ncbi:MAG: DUF4054 domain-containing protein, partial [Plesiomonas sp.]
TDVIGAFRYDMPAFEDGSKWPDRVVRRALMIGDYYTGGSVWGSYSFLGFSVKTAGMHNFAAHILFTTYPNGAEDIAAVDGGTKLNVAAKSIGDMSVTYRVGEMQPTEDDRKSTSDYGVTFLELRRNLMVCGRVV